MKIVIMAGGKGTRISSVNSEVPKPMIYLLGKPVLEHIIESVRMQGYREIIIVVGHLKNVIMEYFKDGTEFDVSIQYVEEEVPLGTAGALYYLKDELKEDFLLLNGDIIFDINIDRMCQWHKKNEGIATILTHPNNHPYDSGIIIADESSCVKEWLHKESPRLWYRNRVNAGIHMLSPEVFDLADGTLFQAEKRLDLDRDVLRPLIENGRLFVYDSPEYIKDMGTPERLYEVEHDILTGLVERKNLTNSQKAVFLDRDGTVNKYVGFLKDIESFELLPEVVEAIRRFNAEGYLVIVVTNQPVIARGEVKVEQLKEIHNKMETLLGEGGAYVDAIYYCPHHPHSGYEGEIPELKIDCECRKPKPGMLLKAAQEFNIDLAQSWMIGDSENDILAGKEAGTRTILIGTGLYGQTATVENLYCAANIILN